MSGRLHPECWFGEIQQGAPCAVGRPDECPPTIAARTRDKGTPWPALTLRSEGIAGLRHYLDGKAVHCGDGLMLQSIAFPSDDYGEYTRALPRGTRVRYEAHIGDREIRATLHVDVGGHEFVSRLEAWMRFSWPGDEDRRCAHID